MNVGTSALDYEGNGILSLMNSFSFYGSGILWGNGNLAVASTGRVFFDGSATTQILISGTLKIAGLTTGAKITPGTPRVTNDAINITPANIDDVTAGKAVGMLSSVPGPAGIFKYAA
jgi:hypothetical protein